MLDQFCGGRRAVVMSDDVYYVRVMHIDNEIGLDFAGHIGPYSFMYCF